MNIQHPNVTKDLLFHKSLLKQINPDNLNIDLIKEIYVYSFYDPYVESFNYDYFFYCIKPNLFKAFKYLYFIIEKLLPTQIHAIIKDYSDDLLKIDYFQEKEVEKVFNKYNRNFSLNINIEDCNIINPEIENNVNLLIDNFINYILLDTNVHQLYKTVGKNKEQIIDVGQIISFKESQNISNSSSNEKKPQEIYNSMMDNLANIFEKNGFVNLKIQLLNLKQEINILYYKNFHTISKTNMGRLLYLYYILSGVKPYFLYIIFFSVYFLLNNNIQPFKGIKLVGNKNCPVFEESLIMEFTNLDTYPLHIKNKNNYMNIPFYLFLLSKCDVPFDKFESIISAYGLQYNKQPKPFNIKQLDIDTYFIFKNEDNTEDFYKFTGITILTDEYSYKANIKNMENFHKLVRKIFGNLKPECEYLNNKWKLYEREKIREILAYIDPFSEDYFLYKELS